MHRRTHQSIAFVLERSLQLLQYLIQFCRKLVAGRWRVRSDQHMDMKLNLRAYRLRGVHSLNGFFNDRDVFGKVSNSQYPEVRIGIYSRTLEAAAERPKRGIE